MDIISSDEWMHEARLSGEQHVRLWLLDEDIRSAQISFIDYTLAAETLRRSAQLGSHKTTQQHLFHHAKTHVCAMRRVSRLLEALSSHRSVFPNPISDVIKLVWRKKKAILDTYTDPRNAIEHIDGEVKGRVSWVMMNLFNDTLAVTDDHEAKISYSNLEAVINGRNEIVQSVVKNISPSATYVR